MEPEFSILILLLLVLIGFCCIFCSEKSDTEDEQEIEETTEDRQNIADTIPPEASAPVPEEILETVNEAFENDENILPPAYHDLFEINKQ